MARKQQKKTPQKKPASRSRREVLLWLRRLDRVKAELGAEQFPRTAQEGFQQCLMLSTTALRWLHESIRNGHPGASEEQVDLERRRLLARLSAAEVRSWRGSEMNWTGSILEIGPGAWA